MARQATGQVIERHGKQGITYAARVRAYGQRHYISLGYSWEGATRLKAAQPKRTWLEPEQVKPLLDATVCGLRGGKTKPDPKTRALFATAICAGMRIGELLALRWREVNLAQGRLTVLDSKTEAGVREIDIWPELHDVLASHKAAARHSGPTDYVFATATGKADTRSNIAKRLKRAVERANQALAGQEDISPIPVELSPHSLRRTFASLLYLRGENPVYVMHQMGHTDPKLALRIYTKVMGEQRRRGPGARLVSVLDGARWTEANTQAETAVDDPAQVTIG